MNDLRPKSRKKREREIVTLDSDEEYEAPKKVRMDNVNIDMSQIHSKLDDLKESLE